MKLFRRVLTSLALAAAVFVAGCASAPSPVQQVAYALVVQQATSRFIEHKPTQAERAERATEVVRVAQVLKLAAGGQTTTVADLQEQALQLAKQRLTEISDLALANTLIATVGDALKQKVTEGVLTPETAVQVVAVLDQIIDTAQLYATSPAAAARAYLIREVMLAQLVQRVRQPA